MSTPLSYKITPDGKVKGLCTGMGGPNDMALDKNGIFYLGE